MLVLGLNGSPRRRGNSAYLMKTFLAEAARYGVRTHNVVVDRQNVLPCKEYTVCETKGTCPIDDDMAREIYGLIREAEVIVTASPIFFYNMTAQLKALVDRCQLFWARKYRLKLRDPLAKTRVGFLLGVGATKGKQLFEPMELSTKYFYDAICARWAGSLTYRGMEGANALQTHPGVAEDVAREVKKLIGPLAGRRRVLFVGRANAGISQLAAAWAQKLFGDKLMVASAGTEPAPTLHASVVNSMAEKGVDLMFLRPRDLTTTVEGFQPDLVVATSAGIQLPKLSNARAVTWDSPQTLPDDPAGMAEARDAVEKKVAKLLADFLG
ncbi:MAG: NAD(P)H-dependent oxidoreductase [Desulfobacterales bacterium]